MRILVADDNKLVHAIIADMLVEHEVSFVMTVRELHNLMSSCQDMYDVLLVDICMPGNGHEAVEIGKAFGSLIPVIFMTGLMSDEYPDALRKPFNKEQLMSAIDKATGERLTR